MHIRLENIRRNEVFLSQLGLANSVSIERPAINEKKKTAIKHKIDRSDDIGYKRRSTRLNSQIVDKDPNIDYLSSVFDSNQDDIDLNDESNEQYDESDVLKYMVNYEKPNSSNHINESELKGLFCLSSEVG